MNVDELLERAASGSESARALVRSGRYVTVTRMADAVGLTRSLPVEIEQEPPIRAKGSTKRRAAAHSSSARPVVAFTKYAAAELRDELAGTADGRETGGGLFGSIERDGSVVVEHVVGPSDWTERDGQTFVIERECWLAIEASRARAGWQWLGDWHTHDERVARPSQRDFRGWVAAVRSSVGLYVGVVAVPDPDLDWRFDAPRFAAWVARDGECVRAKIVSD